MTLLVDGTFAFPSQTALFLDFDGTLVSFKDDPQAVHLTEKQAAMLGSVNAALSGALALISGRDIHDLSARVPNTLWRLGNHGLYRAAPGQMPTNLKGALPSKPHNDLKQKLKNFTGVWIEVKGPILAIHFRANPEVGDEIYAIADGVIAEHKSDNADYMIQRGHDVIELKPAAANKGKALTKQMTLSPFSGRTPVMIGDDTTDEDGFIAAQDLGGLGIKMGEGHTQAQYRLPTRAALYSLLGRLT